MTEQSLATVACAEDVSRTHARTLQLAIPINTLWRWQAGAAVALAAIYLATQAVKLSAGYPYFFGLVPMFDLDAEANLPSFFQAEGLIACGLALLFAARQERAAASSYATRWLLLSLAFFYLGADEAAMLHDRMGPVAMQAIGAQPNHIDWVLPMGILASGFALYMIPFLLGIERTTAIAFALSGAIYVGGAVGAEMLGKLTSELYGYESYPYVLTVTLEEGMEMLGVAMFLRAILRHIGRAGWATLVSVR
jgi:hypothetical protein